MQIFVPFANPKFNALCLDDKRVVKMCTETAQILSTVMYLNEMSNLKAPYKPTHIFHPCVKWAAASVENYAWLCDYFVALHNVYTERYHKIHACAQHAKVFYDYCMFMRSRNHPVPLTPFANVTKDFKHIEDVHEAYRRQLVRKWRNDKRTPRWRKHSLRTKLATGDRIKSFTAWLEVFK